MYASRENAQDNQSKAIANSVGQKKSDHLQSFGFEDNRQVSIAQTKLKATIQNESKTNLRLPPSQKFDAAKPPIQPMPPPNVSDVVLVPQPRLSVDNSSREQHTTHQVANPVSLQKSPILQGKFLHEGDEMPSRDSAIYTTLVELLAEVANVPDDFLDRLQAEAGLDNEGISLATWLGQQGDLTPKGESLLAFGELVNQATTNVVQESLRSGLFNLSALSWGLLKNGATSPVDDVPTGPAIWYSEKSKIRGQKDDPEGEWFSRIQLKEKARELPHLFSTKGLIDAIDAIPLGAKIYGPFNLFGLVQSIVAQETLAQPSDQAIGNPLQNEVVIKIGKQWYSLEQLTLDIKPKLEADLWSEVSKLPKNSRFDTREAFTQALIPLAQQTLKKKQLREDQRREEEEERRLELERMKNPSITPMHSELEESERKEQAIGKAAAVNKGALHAAQTMANKIVQFIDAYHEEDSSDNLYVKLAAGGTNSSGYVGNNAETIKEALTDPEGTLQEKMTHILAFKSLLSGLLLSVEDQVNPRAVRLAKQFGFSEMLVGHLQDVMHTDQDYSDLAGLKGDVIPSRTESVRNKDNVDTLGIPFSNRERTDWVDEDIPEFEVGGKSSTVNDEHEWVKYARGRGFPVKSGPSTHTHEIFEMRKLLGLGEDVSLDQTKLAAIGYLLPIGAHSLFEVQHTAEIFGADHEESQLLYHNLEEALQIGQQMAHKTGKEVIESLGGSMAPESMNYEQNHVLKAHYLLLSSGYVFLGYHGAKKEGYEGIYSGGFKESFEKREKDDPWRGAYLAPDTTTAMGYLSDDGGGLLRIYAPLPVIRACKQARMPLEDKLVENELASRMSMQKLAPSMDDQILVGRERSTGANEQEANSLEAVLSWKAASQCIAIPSLHKHENRSKFEDGLSNSMPIPARLTFEEQMSKGGLEFGSVDESTQSIDSWEPEGAYLKDQGDWDLEAYAAHDSKAKEIPNSRQLVQLRRLGFKVTPGMTWAEIGMISLPVQANAATLREMLDLASGFHRDSPAWTDFVHRFTSASEHTQVATGIYLSGWKAAEDLQWQREHVGAVLNCCQYSFPQDDSIIYQNVNVVGYSNGLFNWTSSFIEACESKEILVHCIEGKNRSATVVAAYLMRKKGWNALQAVRCLTSRRSWASPDINDLLGWEKYLINQGAIEKSSVLFDPKSSDQIDTGVPKSSSNNQHNGPTSSERSFEKASLPTSSKFKYPNNARLHQTTVDVNDIQELGFEFVKEEVQEGGLTNAGNTCYIASVMQMIAYSNSDRLLFTSEFWMQLTAQLHPVRRKVINLGNLIISSILGGYKVSFDLMKNFRLALIAAGWMQGSQDRIGSQQDAGMFLRWLKEEFFKDTSSGVDEQHDYTKIGHYARSEMRTEKVVQIGGLETAQEDRGRSLQSLVESLYTQNQNESDGVGLPIRHRYKVLGLPQELSIQVLRYDFNTALSQYTAKKEVIAVGNTLTFSGGISPQEEKKYTYGLSSFVVHLGNSPNGGHYVTYFIKGGKWFCANDQQVSEVEESQVETAKQSGYIYHFAKISEETVHVPLFHNPEVEREQQRYQDDPEYGVEVIYRRLLSVQDQPSQIEDFLRLCTKEERAGVKQFFESQLESMGDSARQLAVSVIDIIDTIERSLLVSCRTEAHRSLF